ncbi:MAG: NYN domain-containing protein [Pirellulales bacterium]|nr:NYN domain-containing protein [Pirellulales bacterium]
MPLLIDGYNLLYASGIMGRGIGPGGLERSRLALLNFLAASIEPDQLTRTTIVFDAADAPRGLPRAVRHRGITVRFAAQHDSADALIEELIRAESAPRRLTVVSGDNRIRRAARTRRAKSVSSDDWYAELVRAQRLREQAGSESPERPPVPLLEEDVNYWVELFGGDDLLKECAETEKKHAVFNPFPPGYGKDLEET